MQYNGFPLQDIIDKKLHSAFLPNGSNPLIQYNMDYEEAETASEISWTDYWNAPRPERATIVARRRARMALKAMIDYDNAHRPR